MALIGIDIGSTHSKVGLFGDDGQLRQIETRPMQTGRGLDGAFVYDPEQVWQQVSAALEACVQAAGGEAVRGIGIAGMAEAGLLVNRRNGAARSALIPWYDASATAQVPVIQAAGDPQERFSRFGIRPSLKCSLAKLLWLRERQGFDPQAVRWLGAGEWIAYRLSGEMATETSLAGRTYAYDLFEKGWDKSWLARFDLPDSLFAPVMAAGETVGRVQAGKLAGAPVTLGGHDHVCGAFAVGALEPDQVFDSMGTAESLLGAFSVAGSSGLGEAAYRSGLAFGAHVLPGAHYWMGGMNASGGSLEWLRAILGEPAIGYAELQALAQSAAEEPGDLLYLPYLGGSGSPHSDPYVRGALIGLDRKQGRAEIVQAALEGLAYEAEVIRRAAAGLLGGALNRLVVAGGGTHLGRWMQIKANVSRAQVEVLALRETTLLGAALFAGVAGGLFANPAQASRSITRPRAAVYSPQAGPAERYRQIFEQDYLRLQEPLRQYFHSRAARKDAA